MEPKWPKWKFQCWKSPPIWDISILPRKFEESKIRYMKCFDSIFLLILSDAAFIEIWNIHSGVILFYKSFMDSIEFIDFVGLYKCDSLSETKNFDDWSVFMANKNGLLISKKCDLYGVEKEIQKTFKAPIKKCFHKSISYIKTIIFLNNDINILNCKNLEIILNIHEPFKREIDCILFTTDAIVAGSGEILSVFHISVTNDENIDLVSQRQLILHKCRILNLITVDENYFASISFESVMIWRRPEYHMIRMFNIGNESINFSEKFIFSIMNNSKYLTVAFECGFFIFDCIIGSILTKVIDAHDTKIIGIAYLNWLSMLLTIANDGIARFWAFQLSGCGSESRRIHSASPISKTINFSSYLAFSAKKASEDNIFLGKSLEKCEKECQQLSCFYECRHSIKSKAHFVNIEEIGILTNDGSSNLVLWRNRDYVFNKLIKILQN